MHGTGNTHTSVTISQPIPQEASCQIADHIQIIMTGFAEQPKASVLHMSALFHVFILCQVSSFLNALIQIFDFICYLTVVDGLPRTRYFHKFERC